jgi:predicted dehydrogenase
LSTLNRRDFVNGAFAATSLAASSYRRVLGANNRLNLGVIGCGHRGLLKEAIEFQNESNAQVMAVCDTWKQPREKAVAMVKEACGTAPEQFVRYQDLLALKTVDAVIIGTPDHQHCTMLTAAARAGKDAYCEKPLAMSLKELNEAVRAVKSNNRIVQIGTQVRSWAPSVSGRAFVQSGGLGKIFKIEQSRNGQKPYWHSYGERPIAEADVDWKGFLMNQKARPFNGKQYAGWYGFREFSRGPHTNLMVHFIDLVHYVTGAKVPSSVVTMGGKFRFKEDEYTCPDSVECVLEYAQEGFLVRYNSTFGTGANSYLKFIGTKGVMDASNWSKPWTVSGEGSSDPDRIQPGTAVPQVESPHHMKNFFDCVRSRQAPNAPIEAGFAHSIATIMADLSFTTGRKVTYDPAKNSIKA